MLLYHYCIMKNVDAGQQYIGSTVEVANKIKSNDDFKDLVANIAREHDCSVGEFVLISINLLSES